MLGSVDLERSLSVVNEVRDRIRSRAREVRSLCQAVDYVGAFDERQKAFKSRLHEEITFLDELDQELYEVLRRLEYL